MGKKILKKRKNRPPLGRPLELTDEKEKMICAAIRNGAYVETACQLADISKNTLYRWFRLADEGDKRCAAFRDALNKATAEWEIRDLTFVDAAARGGDWKAAAWRLERKAPQHWRRKAEVALTGADGGPVLVGTQADANKAKRLEILKQVLSDEGLDDEESTTS